MSKDLIALLSDREIGRVVQDQRGKLKFTYDEAGREARGAYCFLSSPSSLWSPKHGRA